MWRFGQLILSFPRDGEEMIQFNHTFVVIAQLERELGDSSNFIFRRGRLDRGEIDLWGQILESLSEDAFFYDICALSCRLALHRAAIALVDETSLLTLLSLFVSPDTTGSEAHWGDFHHFLSMHFSPLWPVVFQCLFLHPDLKSYTGKGTSKNIPFWYCVFAGDGFSCP